MNGLSPIAYPFWELCNLALGVSVVPSCLGLAPQSLAVYKYFIFWLWLWLPSCREAARSCCYCSSSQVDPQSRNTPTNRYIILSNVAYLCYIGSPTRRFFSHHCFLSLSILQRGGHSIQSPHWKRRRRQRTLEVEAGTTLDLPFSDRRRHPRSPETPSRSIRNCPTRICGNCAQSPGIISSPTYTTSSLLTYNTAISPHPSLSKQFKEERTTRTTRT